MPHQCLKAFSLTSLHYWKGNFMSAHSLCLATWAAGWCTEKRGNSDHGSPRFPLRMMLAQAKHRHRLLLLGIKYDWKCWATGSNIIHSTADFLIFLSFFFFLRISSLFHKSTRFRRDYSYKKSITSNL